MTQELEFANRLIDFIYASPTAFHAVDAAKGILAKQGFQELKEEDPWSLAKGGKYFVAKNDSAIVAFAVGSGNIEEQGFRIIGAHTDSPTFRIKPSPEMTSEGSYVKLNTEIYGGPILNTWLDRPLAVAGRIALKSSDVLYPQTRLVNLRRPLLVIPNLAIHMNREVNKGVELNGQKDTLPLLAQINENLEQGNYLLSALAAELNVAVADIADFDLFLYEFEKGRIVGLNHEFISSGRLDDLAMVHAGLEALVRAGAGEGTSVLVAFDNEEVGSATKQGADSPFLAKVLERIMLAQGRGREDFFRALAKSFMISADLAHAVHPNGSDKHDPVNKPLLNNGPVIKISANQSYTTDSASAAVYEAICRKAGVPVQKFVNRSDAKGGSTIGPKSATHLDIRSVDIGSPTLAMHSARELAGVLDHTFVTRSFEEFYKL
ncbi:MAG TPA: M18 family aminopeptidase [Selenomonadales bacterium]|nr:M18 family aminopeptidase [Selenomonadales bacterium]